MRGDLGVLWTRVIRFIPNIVREVIDYHFKFQAERRALERELDNLESLSADGSAELQKEWFQGFAQITLSTQLEQFGWINSPAQFVEQLSTHLWATHQLDAFRKAATDYADRLRAAVAPEPPAISRLGVSLIGHGGST